MLKSILLPLCFLALIEGAFRLYAFISFADDHHFQDSKVVTDISQVMRATAHPKKGFTLLPNISIEFLGKKLSSNSLGYRDKEFSTTKDHNTFRIIGIGDSVMMGWGVADDETYLKQLERELPRCGEKKLETYNFAIAGQSAQQEAYVLEAALKYRPDLILIGYVANDWIDESVERQESLFMSPSFALNYLVNTFQGRPWRYYQKSTLKNITSLPLAYRAMSTLLGKTPKIVIMDSRYESELSSHHHTQQLFQDLGFATINTLQEWNPTAKGLNGREAVERTSEFNRLYLIANDWHPNALWHQRVAKRVAKDLREKHCP